MRLKFYCFIVAIVSLLLFTLSRTNAQSTKLQASVGKYNFSVSGIVSPFASIVLSFNSFFMASTVADGKGNFSIQNVLINEGFSKFCLEAVDVKRIGDSLTCFTIPPAKGNTEKKNIFLPPTMGLSGKKINPGSSVFASGYSMPNALVILNISENIILQTKADQSGFYKVEIKNLPAGKYSLFATARYEKRDSEKPTKKQELESLSFGNLIKQNLPKILLILLIILLVLILLIILLSERVRKRIRELLNKKPLSKKKPPQKLHHEWLIGY